MRQLTELLEGILDADYDIVDTDVMPKIGQAIIDAWADVPKEYGPSHNSGSGWLCDYTTFNERLRQVGLAIGKERKGLIPKKTAQTYMWASGGNCGDDACMICLVGNPSDPTSLGIARISTNQGIFFTTSTGYDNGKWVEQGLIKDSDRAGNLNRRCLYTYIEGIINNGIKRKYWIIPGHCFETIKNLILK